MYNIPIYYTEKGRLTAAPHTGTMSVADHYEQEAVRLSAQSQMDAGRGAQLRGYTNAGIQATNALWTMAVTKRNAKIAEINAQRLEAERSFTIKGLQKQMKETEKLQRRKLAETRGKFNVRLAKGIGTKDAVMARLAQGEYSVQLNRIAAENRIRQTDFNFRNRVYDARLRGQNQKIAGARQAGAQFMQAGMSLTQGMDNSFLDGVEATLKTQDLTMDDIDDPFKLSNPFKKKHG